MHVERGLVAPRLDKKDLVGIVLRLQHVELLAAIFLAAQFGGGFHQLDEVVRVLRLQFELDDDHEAAHRQFLLGRIRGIIGKATPDGKRIRIMSHDALRTILPVAGLDPDRARAVEFTGGLDPILPTSFKIGETSAACLAAIGLAVSDLWELRGHKKQDVAVDARRATASLRSGHYLKMEKAEVSHERNPVMGMYPAKDGHWSYIHANFPNHRAAALKVLGVPEEKEAVRQAVAKWDALELEEAIIAAKGAGGMVRTMAEWAKHPQAQALATLPLFEIVKIGDAPVEKLPDGDRTLSGIRVLDLTRVLAGPSSARTLAEHGADVLKITAAHLPNLGYQEFDTGHGKLSAQLDLRDPKQLATLKDLARETDVFVQGYRPGTLSDRGLSPESWRKPGPAPS